MSQLIQSIPLSSKEATGSMARMEASSSLQMRSIIVNPSISPVQLRIPTLADVNSAIKANYETIEDTSMGIPLPKPLDSPRIRSPMHSPRHIRSSDDSSLLFDKKNQDVDPDMRFLSGLSGENSNMPFHGDENPILTSPITLDNPNSGKSAANHTGTSAPTSSLVVADTSLTTTSPTVDTKPSVEIVNRIGANVPYNKSEVEVNANGVNTNCGANDVAKDSTSGIDTSGTTISGNRCPCCNRVVPPKNGLTNIFSNTFKNNENSSTSMSINQKQFFRPICSETTAGNETDNSMLPSPELNVHPLPPSDGKPPAIPTLSGHLHVPKLLFGGSVGGSVGNQDTNNTILGGLQTARLHDIPLPNLLVLNPEADVEMNECLDSIRQKNVSNFKSLITPDILEKQKLNVGAPVPKGASQALNPFGKRLLSEFRQNAEKIQCMDSIAIKKKDVKE